MLNKLGWGAEARIGPLEATEALRCPRCGKTGAVAWTEGRMGQHRVMVGLSAGFVCVTRQYKEMQIECHGCRVAAETLAEASAGPSPVVLLVDDDAALRLWAKQALSAAGFKVLGASCYYQALETIAGADVLDLLIADVVFTDGLDGLEIARRAKVYKPGLAVVHITAYDPPDGKGLSGPLLQKPFSEEQLVVTARAALMTTRDAKIVG